MRSLPVALVMLLASCHPDTEPCPEGRDWGWPALDGGGYDFSRCVPRDGGLDGGHDAGSDAGVCGGPCPAEAPHCQTSSGTCVACLTAEDCDEGVCSDAGECVECVTDGDCSDPAAARCDTATNTCAPCTESAQCAGIEGAGVCDEGACVECTKADETACGANVCDVAARTCTDRPATAKNLCQSCVSDRECVEGRVCMAMTFEGSAVGSFCLWQRGGTGAPTACDIDAARPYARALEGTTISGRTVTVCTLRSTTCPALNDFIAETACTTPLISDDECGVSSLNDGRCRMGESAPRCTIPCMTASDCRGGECTPTSFCAL